MYLTQVPTEHEVSQARHSTRSFWLAFRHSLPFKTHNSSAYTQSVNINSLTGPDPILTHIMADVCTHAAENTNCSHLVLAGVCCQSIVGFTLLNVFWDDYNILNFYSLRLTLCTASLTFNNSTFCPHSVFMCFVWI